MAYQRISAAGEHGPEAQIPKGSVWRSLWNNNRGASLILLAQLVGASMDAMARELQQGDTKFHPFQVLHPISFRLHTVC